jgi:hypothetical protein
MTAKEKLLKMVYAARDPELEIIELEFAKFKTVNEMKRKHGNTGLSREQYLRFLRNERADWQRALDFVNSIKED